MYKPMFNKVLVEIKEEDSANWGKSSETTFQEGVYREGKIVKLGDWMFPFGDTSRLDKFGLEDIVETLNKLVGKQVMWNEGHEAGTVFEEDGRKYALVYWFDLIGVKDEQ